MITNARRLTWTTIEGSVANVLEQIVNADDFGYNASINAAMLRVFERDESQVQQ